MKERDSVTSTHAHSHHFVRRAICFDLCSDGVSIVLEVSKDTTLATPEDISYHWPMYGLGLDVEVLQKVYSGNALKLLHPTNWDLESFRPKFSDVIE